MSLDKEYYLVRVRGIFQFAGIFLSGCGLLALGGVYFRYDHMVDYYGIEGLALLVVVVTVFTTFIGACSTIGRLPFWIARLLPDSVLHSMKDHRNVNEPLIK